MNKQAQIGETMTWVVGTIVIIVILAIAIFIVQLNMIDREFSVDKKSFDLIATKSISSFLSEDSNLQLIKNAVKTKDYSGFESKFKPFLEGLEVNQGLGNWNLELFVNNKKEHSIIIRDTVGKFSYYETNFIIEDDLIKIKFWEDCQGKCL